MILSGLVQAAISVIGFPSSLEELEGFLEVDEKSGKVFGGASDLDLVLDFERHNYLAWTAPRWMTQSDLLLLYHTKNARQKIATLLSEVERRLRELKSRGRWRIWGSEGRERKRLTEMAALLNDAEELSATYSGTILACAEVSAPPELQITVHPREHGRLPQDTAYPYVRVTYLKLMEHE